MGYLTLFLILIREGMIMTNNTKTSHISPAEKKKQIGKILGKINKPIIVIKCKHSIWILASETDIIMERIVIGGAGLHFKEIARTIKKHIAITKDLLSAENINLFDDILDGSLPTEFCLGGELGQAFYNSEYAIAIDCVIAQIYETVADDFIIKADSMGSIKRILDNDGAGINVFWRKKNGKKNGVVNGNANTNAPVRV